MPPSSLEGALLLVAHVLLVPLTRHVVAPRSSLDEAGMDVPEMIAAHGYPVETHGVASRDGYLTTLHRIPARRAASSGRPPVLLQHGILLSSADFVVMGPRHGLGYALSDAGYDVWLGNARGNYYSNTQVNMTKDNQSFWDFSWHEMGAHDLPAVIDYILNATGEEDVFYVGHSMGSAMMFVALHERPEYNAKVRAMFALGPAAYMHHGRSPVSNLVFVSSETQKRMFEAAGVHELLPREPLWRLVGSALCTDSTPALQYACVALASSIFGFNARNFDKSRLPVNLGHFPAGTSRKAAAHFGQAILSGEFRHFNYGAEENLLHYGMETPPLYNLSRITIPVNLYCGQRDLVCDCKDVERLYHELTNAEPKSLRKIHKYSHIDFLWGINARRNLYDIIISEMKMFL